MTDEQIESTEHFDFLCKVKHAFDALEPGEAKILAACVLVSTILETLPVDVQQKLLIKLKTETSKKLS